jgi:3,4-dihydroxy 2-butanone 4-phosphate synthase / GTP cyclohydrolase II
MEGRAHSPMYFCTMSMLDTIPEAIEAIRRGEVIIVVDDEDRENEGDFLIAARHATPEVVNFMATHGRGLICAPLIENRCDELGLDLMVQTNNAAFETPFTVSVDLMGHGCTTGISAQDRSKTIQALIDPTTDPNELGRPGHIFPLRAKPGGVLRRAGHTEAAIDFSRLAGFEPAGVIVEIMNEDGTMARLPECRQLANEHQLKLVSIADLIQYRLANETLIQRTLELNIETAFGTFKAIAFRQLTNDVEHLALTLGEWDESEDVPVRVHSSSMLGDVFQMTDFGKGPELHAAMRQIQNQGKGAIVYINKLDEGRGLIEELKTYQKHQTTPQAANINTMDSKDYGIGAQIIRNLGIRRLHILSDHPRKKGIIGYGLEITGTTPLSL